MAGEGNQVHANRWVVAARPYNSTAAYGTADLGGRNLYGLLVSRGAPTYGGSTDEIVVSIGVERDAN